MGDFNKELCFGEFLLGQSLTPYEKQLAISEATQTFNSSPYESIQNLNIACQLMEQVYSLNDAMQIALARNMLIAEVYSAMQQSGETSVLFDLIQKYVVILQYDAVNKLVLTQQDVDGFINLMQFSTELSGQVFNPTYAELTQANQEIQKTFVYGSLDDKQYLCVVNTYHQLLVMNYQQMNAANQQQLVNQYLAQSQPTQQYQQQYNNNNNTGSMNWNAYNMLSKMSLQNHVGMMNSIEAIGGSGDYWYLK